MDLDSSWARLPEGARQALEQQWRGVAAGGLPCGAAVVDRDGAVVASGRNRAYEAPTGDDPLEHTRLAHAELNALARVPSDVDHQTLVVWSTQHPVQHVCGGHRLHRGRRRALRGRRPERPHQSY